MKISNSLIDFELKIFFGFLFLQWISYFTEEELLQLRNLLQLEKIYEELKENISGKHGFLLYEHETAYILANIYHYIDKEGVLKLFSELRPRTVILFLKYLNEMLDFSMYPLSLELKESAELFESFFNKYHEFKKISD